MDQGISVQVEKLISQLPPVESIGFENWADLLAIQTRLPNISGHEQARIDSMAINFTPFVQPDFLCSLFKLPVSARSNGKLFKSVIAKNKELYKWPLTKDGINYKIYVPNLMFSALSMLNKKFVKSKAEDPKINFLMVNRELINDRINSSHLKGSSIYDVEVVKNMANCFFAGDKSYANHLDWWLTVDLWQEGINEDKISILRA